MAIRTPPNLPFDYQIPDGMPLTYANLTYAQVFSGDFILSFFQAAQVIALTDEEAQKMKDVPARCVARVAMNAGQIASLMTVLKDLLEDMAAQAAITH